MPTMRDRTPASHFSMSAGPVRLLILVICISSLPMTGQTIPTHIDDIMGEGGALPASSAHADPDPSQKTNNHNVTNFKVRFKGLIDENQKLVDEYKSLLGLTLDMEKQRERSTQRSDWILTRLYRLRKQHNNIKLNMDRAILERNDLQKQLYGYKMTNRKQKDEVKYLREAVADLAIEKVRIRHDMLKWRRRAWLYQGYLLHSHKSDRLTFSFWTTDFWQETIIWYSVAHQLSVILILMALAHCFACFISPVPFSKSQYCQTETIPEIVPLSLCNEAFNFQWFQTPNSSINKPSNNNNPVPLSNENVTQTKDMGTDSDIMLTEPMERKQIDDTTCPVKSSDKLAHCSVETQTISTAEKSIDANIFHNKENENVIQQESSSQTEFLDMMVISRDNTVKLDNNPPTEHWKDLRKHEQQKWNLCLVNVINNDTFVKDASVETEVTSTLGTQTNEAYLPQYPTGNYIQDRFLHDLAYNAHLKTDEKTKKKKVPTATLR